MKLTLKNIGKIRSACVDINGITVIAGENNTGKSTVGKSLYAVFNSLYKSEKKIVSERTNSVENQLQMLYRDVTGNYYYDLDETDLARKIVAEREKEHSFDTLKQAIYETIEQYDDKIARNVSNDGIAMFADRIATNLSVDDEVIFRTVLQHRFDAEFNEQVSNLFEEDRASRICLEIRGEKVDVLIDHNRVVGLNKRLSLGTEAIYIDDPFALDEVPGRLWRVGRRYTDHRTHLKEKLYFSQPESNIVEEIVTNNKLEYIYSKISSVCQGDVVKGKRASLGYRVAGSDKTLDVRNLSTGLKTFAILKTLLLNGHVEPNGTIILDEPEIHLHPQWQLLFAELIVLLHREFGLHVLLNTHSPYFLNAIEVYAAKYNVADKCKYYLTENVNESAELEDVTGNIEKIYGKLARPLQDLENMRYNNDQPQ